MTDLRKAAEMALESWDFFFSQAHPEVVGLMYGNDWAKIAKERTEALRQALAQPEQVLTAKVVVTGREWVGLTRRELDIATLGLEDLSDCYKAIEAKLKEKNT